MNKIYIKLIIILPYVIIFSICFLYKINVIDIRYVSNEGFTENTFRDITNSIDYNEQKILINTLISIPSYINDYGKIYYQLNKEIFYLVSKGSLNQKEMKELGKYYFLVGLDVHDLKLINFDENIGIDSFIEKKLIDFVN